MRRLLSLNYRVFCLLLRCYPTEFRERFGAEMADVFAEQLEEEWRKKGLAGVLRVSLTAALTAAIPQHLQNPSVIAGALSVIGSFVLCTAFLRAVSR
jgi:hypothetical protein